MWEKRYGAVSPPRTPTNRRLYSDADIARLNCLRLATAAGHSIGNIATLSLKQLQGLIAKSDPKSADLLQEKLLLSPAGSFQKSALDAIRAFDSSALDEALRKALVSLGHQGLLIQVISPLARTVGEYWRSGKLSAAHEHFLTAAVKIFLGHLSSQFGARAEAPRLVVGTPAGQLHELGAVIARDAAAQIGWQTTYLGPSLPAAEIAGAATQNGALAVALSIVYPDDDPELARELTDLRRFLPIDTKILVGGPAAASYSDALSSIGAMVTNDIVEFCDQLDLLRRSARRNR
jgi:methanogenic corrinoid protein MtbC1